MAKGWGQDSDCLSGQTERIENALVIITRLQMMLESLNGMIFQKHYPYYTVAPGWPYPLALGAYTPEATRWVQGSKYLSGHVITLIPLYI